MVLPPGEYYDVIPSGRSRIFVRGMWLFPFPLPCPPLPIPFPPLPLPNTARESVERCNLPQRVGAKAGRQTQFDAFYSEI